MDSSNKLIIATAGSGKTTLLVNEALKKDKKDKILIATYTRASEDGIRKKFIEKHQCVPQNVTIQTWFSFLLQHGVLPFQRCIIKDDLEIAELSFDDKPPRRIPKKNTEKYYLTKDRKIYSDKLAEFSWECNKLSNGDVIDRLSRIYKHIFIDEVQDLAGYDLDFLKLLFDCQSNVLLVGDPRQRTYVTNHQKKNQHKTEHKKKNQNTTEPQWIEDFIKDKSIKNITIDDNSLNTNYRSCSAICDFSNKLYPAMKKTNSGNTHSTVHDGVFLIKKQDTENYLANFRYDEIIQLRWDKRESVNEKYRVATFGSSKGLEFDRVLIYPTNEIIEWIKNDNDSLLFEDYTSRLPQTSRAKFYVAITRARYSVGIVFDEVLHSDDSIKLWQAS